MLKEKILLELQEYIDAHLNISYSVCEAEMFSLKKLSQPIMHNELDDFIKTKLKPTFAEVLFQYIDREGKSDTEVYKKAGLDRRHFSKIRSNPDYRIGKNPAIALAFALKLNKKETEELLGSAGFSLSESDTFDLVIQFCLEKKIYYIDDVNQALDYFSLKPLAGVSE